MAGRVRRAADAAAGVAFAHHHIAEVERVVHLLVRFFERDAFGAANLVITRCVPLARRGAAMIEDGNAREVNAERLGLAANDRFAPDERDAGEALSDDERGGA